MVEMLRLSDAAIRFTYPVWLSASICTLYVVALVVAGESRKLNAPLSLDVTTVRVLSLRPPDDFPISVESRTSWKFVRPPPLDPIIKSTRTRTLLVADVGVMVTAKPVTSVSELDVVLNESVFTVCTTLVPSPPLNPAGNTTEPSDPNVMFAAAEEG